MHEEGSRHAIGFIAAPHHSYSSCQQYKENVSTARQELRRRNGADIEVNARHVRSALDRLRGDVRKAARVVFTAHSVPSAMSGSARYQDQITQSARLVANAAGVEDWAVVRTGSVGGAGAALAWGSDLALGTVGITWVSVLSGA